MRQPFETIANESGASEAKKPGDALHEIAEILATRVRVLTAEQIAETWYPNGRQPVPAAQRVLRRLVAKGLVLASWGMAPPRITLTGPLYRYRACEKTPEPDFGRLAWQAEHRFRRPPVRTLFAQATKAAKLHFGRECRRAPRSSELCHDIHVSEVFLSLRKQGQEKLWKGEDELSGTIRPDAVLGEVAVDFIGSGYSKTKIMALHRKYVLGFAAFELW